MESARTKIVAKMKPTIILCLLLTYFSAFPQKTSRMPFTLSSQESDKNINTSERLKTEADVVITVKYDSIAGYYSYFAKDTILLFIRDSTENKDRYILKEAKAEAYRKLKIIAYKDSVKATPFYKREQILKANVRKSRIGAGNSSFSFSLANYERILNHFTLGQLESSLGKWRSDANSNGYSYHFNDKTKQHDLPFYIWHYDTNLKEVYFSINAETNLSNKSISKITIYSTFNGMKMAQFKRNLLDNGYLVNERLSRIFMKQTWINESRKMMMLMSYNEIEISKTK